MAVGDTTIGKRHDFTDDQWTTLEPGDYGRCTQDGSDIGWHFRPPQRGDGRYFGVGGLGLHTVVEHEDGTITVSPSILTTGHHGATWHGYLVEGVWREIG